MTADMHQVSIQSSVVDGAHHNNRPNLYKLCCDVCTTEKIILQVRKNQIQCVNSEVLFL